MTSPSVRIAREILSGDLIAINDQWRRVLRVRLVNGCAELLHSNPGNAGNQQYYTAATDELFEAAMIL